MLALHVSNIFLLVWAMDGNDSHSRPVKNRVLVLDNYFHSRHYQHEISNVAFAHKAIRQISDVAFDGVSADFRSFSYKFTTYCNSHLHRLRWKVELCSLQLQHDSVSRPDV